MSSKQDGIRQKAVGRIRQVPAQTKEALGQRVVPATADAMTSVAARNFGVSASVMRPTSPYLDRKSVV